MTDDDWTVKRGDSLMLMTAIEDASVDLVLTDPPYSSGGQFRSDRNGSAKAKYLTSGSANLDRLPEFYGDSRTERGLLLWSALWLGEAWRVTKTGGAIALFCDWRSLPTFSDALQAGGWSWRGVGVWVKPQHKSRPVAGGLWNDSEFILWGSKGPRIEGEPLPGTWEASAPGAKTRLHPTEKPQSVLVDLVRLAPDGGVVLDPFAGSGAVGVAALSQGRTPILFELSRDYAALATRRLHTVSTRGVDAASLEPSLFDGDEVAAS